NAIQLYADFVKSIPIGVLILRPDDPADDRTLRLIDANPSASRLLGFDLSGVLGQTMVQVFPSTTPAVLKVYADVARTGAASPILEMEYGDGRVNVTYWSFKAFPLPDGRVGVAFEDIGARKQGEQALALEPEQLITILNTSPVGVTLTCGDAVQFVNLRMRELIGGGVGDDLNKYLVQPEDAARLRAARERDGIVRDFEVQVFDTD